MQQWSQNMNTGTMISEVPHFYLYNNGQSQAISQLGYFYWKQYNHYPLDANTYSTTSAPIFRVEEVWLNYAEAMFELGTFSQTIADQTINNLRPRAGLPPMTVANINPGFDTNRDPDVDPVLWEIRRERRVELMGDGFRFNDIKRWAKGVYLNKIQLGVSVNNANYGNKLSISGGGQIGYVIFFPNPVGWQNKYYLEPIPTQELNLDKQLVQNPGW
jgi:starch-binding outer membrane protein, SusD/RagB family